MGWFSDAFEIGAGATLGSLATVGAVHVGASVLSGIDAKKFAEHLGHSHTSLPSSSTILTICLSTKAFRRSRIPSPMLLRLRRKQRAAHGSAR